MVMVPGESGHCWGGGGERRGSGNAGDRLGKGDVPCLGGLVGLRWVHGCRELGEI